MIRCVEPPPPEVILIEPGEISGVVFEDRNGNGELDADAIARLIARRLKGKIDADSINTESIDARLYALDHPPMSMTILPSGSWMLSPMPSAAARGSKSIAVLRAWRVSSAFNSALRSTWVVEYGTPEMM